MEDIYYALNPWWNNKDFEVGIKRKYYLDNLSNLFKRKQINVIIGSRRIGKTTIVKQVIKSQLGDGIDPKQIFFVALDHPQLMNVSISQHLKNFRKLFMHPRRKKVFLYLDEVQQSPDWEIELKSLYDTENVKMVCTGSTSALLRSQRGKLTGRQIVTTIYPLSFSEYLLFKKVDVEPSESYKYERLVEDYLNVGGYPENVLQPCDEYLTALLDNILARDIVSSHSIRKTKTLKEMLLLLGASVGSYISYNRLAKILAIKSVDTVKEYIGYFEEAFLVKTLDKWTMSYTDRVYSNKKIYFFDTGIKTLLTGKGDFGFKAENSIFFHLLKMGESIGYYRKNKGEVDFVVGKFKNTYPVEAKYIEDFDWQDKRFSTLKIFLKAHQNIHKATIVVKNKEIEIKEGKIRIETIPLWKFLIGK